MHFFSAPFSLPSCSTAVPLTDRNLPTSFWNPYNSTAAQASAHTATYPCLSQSSLGNALTCSPTISQPLMQLESLSQLSHLQPHPSTSSGSYTPQMSDILPSAIGVPSSASGSSSARKTNRNGTKSKATSKHHQSTSADSKSPNHHANHGNQSTALPASLKAIGHADNGSDSSVKLGLHSPDAHLSNMSSSSVLLQSNGIGSPGSFARPMMPVPTPSASAAGASGHPVDFYSNSPFVPPASVASNCDWSAGSAMNSSASYFNSVFHPSSSSSSSSASLDAHLSPHSAHLQHNHHLPPHHSPQTLDAQSALSLTASHHQQLHALHASGPEVPSSSLSSAHSSPGISQPQANLTHLTQSLSSAILPTSNVSSDLLDPTSQTSSHVALQSSPLSPLGHAAHAPSHVDLTSSQPLLASHPFHHPQPGYPAQDSSPAAAATQSFAYQHPPIKRACLERRDSPCIQPPAKLSRLSSERFLKDDLKCSHHEFSYGSAAYNGLLLGSSQSSSLEPLDSNNNSLNGLSSSGFSPISAYSNYYGLGSSIGSDGTASAIAFHAGNALHQPTIGHSIPPQYAPYNTYGNYHGYGLSSVSGTHLFQQHLARFSALI
jgi:hypothetical protein